ncbi:unnamed protein product [Lupinus luteus]|uniref:WAT1-related protein n=1 Tax=Lupinus luteus TaxID=3873 RepID=A0AAV1WJW6_LUPLU
MKRSICNVFHGLIPAILMVMVQVALAGVSIFFKLAINVGLSVRVATAYRLTFASAFTVPLALISERDLHIRVWKLWFSVQMENPGGEVMAVGYDLSGCRGGGCWWLVFWGDGGAVGGLWASVAGGVGWCLLMGMAIRLDLVAKVEATLMVMAPLLAVASV